MIGNLISDAAQWLLGHWLWVVSTFCALVVLFAVLGIAFAAIERALESRGRRIGARPTSTTEPKRSPLANRLTLVAAAIATGVAMTGMWQLFTESIPIPVLYRLPLFAFIEFGLLASAVRARDRVREGKGPGLDGAAVWILAGLSAVLASLDAQSFPEVLVRLTAPLVAGWLWDRGLRIERHRLAGTSGIHWRLTPERILIRLGLAEARTQTSEDVVAHRLFVTVAHRTRRVRAFGAGGKGWQHRWAQARLAAALDAAVAAAGLATDPARQRQMRATIAAVNGVESLVALDDEPPWLTAAADPAIGGSDRQDTANSGGAAGGDDLPEAPPLDAPPSVKVAWVRLALAAGRIETAKDCMEVTGWAKRTAERHLADARKPRSVGENDSDEDDDREDVTA